MRTRHSSVVFLPVILSLLAFNGYYPVQSLPLSDLLDRGAPEISKDCFPVSTSPILEASKSKTQFSSWHARLFLRVIHQSHQYETHFISAEIASSPTISQVASQKVMRC